MNRTLLGFIRKEFLQALRDPRMRILLFVAPVVQLTVFGVAISNEIKNIRLAAVYAPNDRASREIFDRAIASGWFRHTTTSGNDPFAWVKSNEADAVLIAPPGGLARSIERENGRFQVLINGSNVVRAQAVENYLQAIVNQSYAAGTSTPLAVDVRFLYNPTLTTSHFMVPGVLGLLVTIVTVTLTSMSIAREREIGTFETLIAAPVYPWEIILGKSLPFVTLGMIQLPLILVAAVLIFGVPVRGPIVLVLLAAFCYVWATVALGILISTLARNQQQAMLGGFLFLFPATLFSGLLFPLDNMPLVFRLIAYCNPLAHFIFLMRNILLKGGDPSFVLRHTLALAAIAVVLVWFAFRRFHVTLR